MNTQSYKVKIGHFRDDDVEGYEVIVPALPGCITWGRTYKEAVEMAEECIRGYIESLVSSGEPVPEGDVDAERPVETRVDVAAKL